jgi:PAS domain S-box-containing protein
MLRDDGSGHTSGSRIPADLVLDALGLAVVATDADGTVVNWNAAAADLYGWSTQEAVGRPVTDLLAPWSALADATLILTSGRPWSGEFTVRHKDGRLLQVRISGRPVTDAAGAVVGVVGVSGEITAERGRIWLPEQAAPTTGRRPASPDRPFDPDAAAVEIVTSAFDPELRAAAGADPHASVLPADGLSPVEIDELLASLVALTVHAVSAAAHGSARTVEQVLAIAALRLRAGA